MHKKQIQVIGYASCYGARDQRCDTGPLTLKNLRLVEQLNNVNFDAQWSIVHWAENPARKQRPLATSDTLALVTQVCTKLAKQTHAAIETGKLIVVIGGDHSSAIGTWSGVSTALSAQVNPQTLGLIWIDAHMDSHTMHTSLSGAIHGMPVASLLGYGDSNLTQIMSAENKICPENLCLIGIRSFEPAEAELLNALGVKIFYMQDIREHGFADILKQAKAHVTQNSDRFGLSLDLDAIDPDDAPGVGSRENHGISGKSLIKALKNTDFGHNFIGIEVAELNSRRDHVDKTARLAIESIVACLSPAP